jgi:hypothetical protein
VMLLNFRSLIAVAAITIAAVMSIAQAADQPGRKTVHQPKVLGGAMVRSSYAELRTSAPAAPDPRRLTSR